MNPATLPGQPAVRSGWTRRTWLRLLAYASPAWMAGYALGWEPRRLRVRRLRLAQPSRLSFAFFTDLHFKGDPHLLDAVVEAIRREHPAFAVFGGDLIEHTDHLAGALARLGRLGVPLYGVPGNHDYWSGADFHRIAAAFQATGGAWLLDTTVNAAGSGLWLAGHTCVGDTVLAPVADRPTVGLIHYPAWADRLPAGYRLVLAGHSHGGQVRLPWVGALVKPHGVGPYERGHYPTPAGPLYVSSGVGTFHINVRFLCPPEVVFVEV